MNKTVRTVFFVALIATLVVLSGCNLKASNAPATKATATSELNFITPTTGQGLKGDLMTQTAQAGEPAVATATPAVVNTEAVVAATTAPTEAPKATDKPASIPTLSKPSTYTLQKGEWPICIARRYDVDLAAMFSLNGLSMSSRPGTGTVLKIPSAGSWSSGSYGARALHTHANYTVKSGDTIYTIACYFGDVSPEGILAANGFSSASDIKAGSTIKIP
jgi:LysM repeat protein